MDEPESKDAIAQWVQVDAEQHYASLKYVHPRRMASIGYQLRFLHTHFPEATVLEVGVGFGMTTTLLRRFGHEVITLDVDKRLHPDRLGSVTAIPCRDGEVDAFVCCQVLEHVPWDMVDIALGEIHRVVRDGGVISVPTNRPTLLIMKFDSKRFGSRRITFGSRRNKPMRNRKGEHHWELESNVTTRDFTRKIESAGFEIIDDLQPLENMHHQFFVVRKPSSR